MDRPPGRREGDDRQDAYQTEDHHGFTAPLQPSSSARKALFSSRSRVSSTLAAALFLPTPAPFFNTVSVCGGTSFSSKHSTGVVLVMVMVLTSPAFNSGRGGS